MTSHGRQIIIRTVNSKLYNNNDQHRTSYKHQTHKHSKQNIYLQRLVQCTLTSTNISIASFEAKYHNF